MNSRQLQYKWLATAINREEERHGDIIQYAKADAISIISNTLSKSIRQFYSVVWYNTLQL